MGTIKKYVNQELLEKQILITKKASYMASALMIIIVLVCYFLLDIKHYLHVVLSPLILGIIINIWIFKFHKKLFYTYLVLFSLSLFGMLSISAITGGIDSPFIYTMIVLPIGAFITSRKQGRYWVSICVASLIALYGLSVSYDLPNIIKPEYRHEFAFILNVFSVTMVSGLALSLTKSSFNAYKSKDEIKQKNLIIEEKNTQIMDSISYAKRIQDASLPTSDYLKKIFNEHFVYYMPKDVVSGDFYWAYQHGQLKIWVTADCTGHGVPGAFMSLIGTMLLNDIIIGSKVHDPKEIAEQLSDWITKLLHQNGGNETTKDGMDLMICCYNESSKILTACGAYNSLYLVRNNVLSEYKGSNKAIGYNHLKKANEQFVGHSIQLQPNDTIYTFSDGFMDQKGGEKGKKYFSKRFKQLLQEISLKSMPEQEEILSQTMMEWKKETEQVDDILVFGVRIN